MKPIACVGVALTAVSCAVGAVEIDGRLDPGEWAGARHVTEFRRAFDLRDSEQLLVKLSYRFEI